MLLKRNVDMSLVVMSPASSAAPMGVPLVTGKAGKKRFTKVLASRAKRTGLLLLSTKKNQKLKGTWMRRAVLTLGFRRTCQPNSGLPVFGILSANSARIIWSLYWPTPFV